MRLRTYVVGVGALIALAAVLVGFFLPVQVAGDRGTLTCGTAFVRDAAALNQYNADSFLYGSSSDRNLPAECKADRDSRKILVFVALGIGLVVAAGGALVRPQGAATTDRQTL